MGGNLFEYTRPIKQYEVDKTYYAVVSQFFFVMGLNKNQYALVGSAGKKPGIDDLSGDLDIAVDKQALCNVLNCKYEDVLNVLKEALENAFDLEVKLTIGFNIVSIAFPIPYTKKEFVQVDLMLTDSIEWTKFASYSPDYRINESKYKSYYRNILLIAIARNFIFSIAYNKDGEIKEMDRYALDLSKGLKKTKYSYVGKKGQIRKTASKTVLEIITNDPEELVHIILGPTFTIEDAKTYESLLAVLDNPKFNLFGGLKEQILEDFKNALDLQFLPEPDLNI